MTTPRHSCARLTRRAVLLALLLPLLASAEARARQPGGGRCEESQGEFENYVVRRLEVKGPRWGAPPILPQTSDDPSRPVLAPGEPFSAGDRSTNTFAVLRRALIAQDVEPLAFLPRRGGFGVTRISSCLKRVGPAECRASLGGSAERLAARGLDISKCVDVTVRPFHVRVDMVRVGSNYLPVPRSNLPTAFKRVPAPLLALAPSFGAVHDRRYGVSEEFDAVVDLLDLHRTLKAETPSDIEAGLRQQPPRKMLLEMAVRGEKSVNRPFYSANARLFFGRRETGRTLEGFGAETSFDATREPLGDGKVFRNVARLGFSLLLKPRTHLLGGLRLSAAYRRSNNSFFSDDQQRREVLPENAFEARALADGRLFGGAARLGLWADSTSPESAAGTYRRAVALFGYRKEIPLALNQTVGVEAIAGAGRVSSSAPAHARFYGGSTLGDYLYEGPDSELLRAFPRGPLLRSYGSGQATARTGADSFWHVNFSASIPIPALSHPLVPDVRIADDSADDEEEDDGPAPVRKDVCGKVITPGDPTLKNAIKQGAVNSAGSFLAAFYRNQGLARDDARARACADVKELRPALAFIADQANLYSVKPLFMFEAARLGTRGAPDPRVRVGVGGGVQLSLIVARFELGYLRSVRRAGGDPRGNLVARLVFQNLF